MLALDAKRDEDAGIRIERCREEVDNPVCIASRRVLVAQVYLRYPGLAQAVFDPFPRVFHVFCSVAACEKLFDSLDRIVCGFLRRVPGVFGRATRRWRATLLHSCPNAAMHAPGSRK
jgi:hypothetical protein